MALLNPGQALPMGATMPFTAASGGGDEVVVDGTTYLFVRNGGGSAITATIVRPGNDEYGLPIPDIAKSVAAGATEMFGPLPRIFNDPVDNRADITYSGVTTVTVCAMRAG